MACVGLDKNRSRYLSFNSASSNHPNLGQTEQLSLLAKLVAPSNRFGLISVEMLSESDRRLSVSVSFDELRKGFVMFWWPRSLASTGMLGIMEGSGQLFCPRAPDKLVREEEVRQTAWKKRKENVLITHAIQAEANWIPKVDPGMLLVCMGLVVIGAGIQGTSWRIIWPAKANWRRWALPRGAITRTCVRTLPITDSLVTPWRCETTHPGTTYDRKGWLCWVFFVVRMTLLLLV